MTTSASGACSASRHHLCSALLSLQRRLHPSPLPRHAASQQKEPGCSSPPLLLLPPAGPRPPRQGSPPSSRTPACPPLPRQPSLPCSPPHAPWPKHGSQPPSPIPLALQTPPAAPGSAPMHRGAGPPGGVGWGAPVWGREGSTQPPRGSRSCHRVLPPASALPLHRPPLPFRPRALGGGGALASSPALSPCPPSAAPPGTPRAPLLPSQCPPSPAPVPPELHLLLPQF